MHFYHPIEVIMVQTYKNRYMKTEKQTYTAPELTKVLLDNEISLALESTPPAGPNEVYNTPTHFEAGDPLKG